MPKIKTRRSAAKRFEMTGSGNTAVTVRTFVTS